MSKRIMYLRDNKNPQGKGNPIATIAIEINDVVLRNAAKARAYSKVEYQISCCHPNDQFDRFSGQMKALLKLEGRPIFVDNIKEECISIHQVSSMVMTKVSADKSLPKRIRQSAQRWLTSAAQLKVNSDKPALFSLAALKN